MVCVGLAGSNPIKFVKQAKGLGIKQQLVGGSTVADDTIIGAYGDEADGLHQHEPLFAGYRQRRQQAFYRRASASTTAPTSRIGHYAACFYIDGQVIEAALAKTGGKSDNPDEFVKAIRSVSLAETPRGPISFDDHGNVVIDVYVRRVEKQGGKMVNKTIKTYHKVSQFWTMDPR